MKTNLLSTVRDLTARTHLRVSLIEFQLIVPPWYRQFIRCKFFIWYFIMGCLGMGMGYLTTTNKQIFFMIIEYQMKRIFSMFSSRYQSTESNRFQLFSSSNANVYTSWTKPPSTSSSHDLTSSSSSFTLKPSIYFTSKPTSSASSHYLDR